MIIWICQEINFLSLSMLSLQYFISVKGVTTIFYFSPEGHNDFIFCLVSHCGPFYMSRRISVQGEVSSK